MRLQCLLLSLAMCAGCSNPECTGTLDSGVKVSGVLTIPDGDVASLVIEICMDSLCAETSSTPSPAASTADAGGSLVVEYRYTPGTSDAEGAITLTQTAANTYDVQGSAVFAVAPSGTATGGTVTIHITSGGSGIYSQSFPVDYQTGTTCGAPYELSSVTL